MMQLNSNQIAEIIPHRYPFALVDRIVDGEVGQYHVMPGVLIIEALAQVGAVTMLSMPENKGKIGLFGGIKNARFRRQVTPGDVLELECTILKQKGPVAVAEAKATVGGRLAVSAELTFALAKDL